MHSFSLLRRPTHSTELRRNPAVPVSRLTLSSYRYASKRSNHVRTRGTSIHRNGFCCERRPPILSKDAAQYQKRRPQNSPEVVEMDALCEACDGRLSCSAVQVALFHHPLLDSKAQRERESAPAPPPSFVMQLEWQRELEGSGKLGLGADDASEILRGGKKVGEEATSPSASNSRIRFVHIHISQSGKSFQRRSSCQYLILPRGEG